MNKLLCVIFAVICLITLVSCDKNTKLLVEMEGDSTLIQIGRGSFGGYQYRIVYDPETLVIYYYRPEHLQPLYNADGTLKLYSKNEGETLEMGIVIEEQKSAEAFNVEHFCEKGNHDFGDEFVDTFSAGQVRGDYIFYPATKTRKYCGYSIKYMQGFEIPKEEENADDN